MQYIFSTDTITGLSKSDLGGKAFHLFELLQLGIHVPQFLVIPNSTFHQIIKDAADENAKKNYLQQFQFEERDISDIKNFFPENAFFAVRSSAVDEDGQEHSFAGQFETKLFVPLVKVEDAVKEVWLSALSERVLQYNRAHGKAATAGIAVIIQQMIKADVSGVAFGINPLQNHAEEKIITAVFGLGEGLVSGYLHADEYKISASGITKTIGNKEEKFVFDEENNAGIKIISVHPGAQNLPTLSDEQVIFISSLLGRLEKQYHHPQDIEFAFSQGKFYLLQTRPVTTYKTENRNATEFIWDNSNIIESYPGLTLPLTYSFITKMYEAAYRQLSAVLGISNKKIKQHADVYTNMLGLLEGRVYYNLNSWYTALSLLPGYNVNAAFMEKMMGVKEKFPVIIESKKTGVKDYWEILTAVYSILRNLFTIEKQRKRFQTHFDAVMQKYEHINLEAANTGQLMQYYLDFEQTLVKKWKAPLVNDFFAMIFFGLLQKQIQKAGFDEKENLHNDLLSGSKDIISTQPVELTLKITDSVKKDPAARKLFSIHDPEQIFLKLQQSEFIKLRAAIDAYIRYWGDRTVGELKLETVTYHQQPADYIRVIQAYIKNETNAEKYFSKETTFIRSNAEKKVKNRLRTPIKKVIFGWILKKARYFVSNRENLRYQRTRGFGMVRKIFLSIGKKFENKNMLQDARDIFYLTKEEIFQAIENSANDQNLKEKVEYKKNEYRSFEKMLLPERMHMKANENAADFAIDTMVHQKQIVHELKGIGCSTGKIKGKIKVVHHPQEIESLNGDILVTSSTDPGWVTLFPTCSAILVERGSLLSHSAIVSREFGIPCIVAIKNLLQYAKTGMEVEMDGSTGVIKIIKNGVA